MLGYKLFVKYFTLSNSNLLNGQLSEHRLRRCCTVLACQKTSKLHSARLQFSEETNKAAVTCRPMHIWGLLSGVHSIQLYLHQTVRWCVTGSLIVPRICLDCCRMSAIVLQRLSISCLSWLLWHCWFGHLTCNVLSETLSLCSLSSYSLPHLIM